MGVPWQVMNKIRRAIVSELGWKGEKTRNAATGEVTDIEESFFTFDRDSQQIVSNRRFDDWHFIFDMEGNLIKKHKH